MKSRTKAHLILLLIGIFLVLSAVNIKSTINQAQNGPKITKISDKKEKLKKVEKNTLSSSGTDYKSVVKTIDAGLQANAWSETNIENDDGSYDATDFTMTSNEIHKDWANKAWDHAEVEDMYTDWGTTEGSVGYALHNNDDKYLYVSAQPATGNGGKWIKLEWGDYSNFDSSIHSGIYQIKIKYEIMIDSILPLSRVGTYLDIKVRTSDGSWSEWIRIAKDIDDGKIVYGTITIDETTPLGADLGTILSSIRAGYCIERIEVKMGVQMTLIPAWVNVDYLDIYYYYDEQELDFEYELEFNDNEIPDFSKYKSIADFTIDLEDSVPDVYIYLYDYANSKWDKFGTTNSWYAETIEFRVEKGIDSYFNNENKTQIRFWTPVVFHHSSLVRLWVDMIDIEFTSDIIFDIITPRNTTYYKDYLGNESGYYPATYGFEDVENGDIPNGWIEYSVAPSSVGIEAEKCGHKKVLALTDSTGDSFANIRNDFQGKVSGTIEFWVLTENVNRRTYMVFRNSSDDIAYYIAIHSGYLRIWYDNPLTSVDFPITINTWYHIKTSFNCTSHKASVWINNDLKLENGNFINNVSLVERFYLYTNPNEDNFKTYFDAIGYSWDDDYEIGNNLNEGLLFNFTTYKSLDWASYSLDGQAEKKLWENWDIENQKSVIFLFEDGIHAIQLFGNDGTIDVHSEKLYFTLSSVIPNISINSPENKIYNEWASGHYLATYSFENDNDATLPANWSTHPIYSSGYIIASEGGHKKVIEIDNKDYNIYNVDNLFKPQVNGTIEFWFKTTNSESDPQVFRILQDNDIGPNMRIYKHEWGDHAEWQYRIGDSWADIYQENGIDQMPWPKQNTWMHIRIDFECGNGGYMGLAPDTYRVIIDNITSEAYGFRFGSRDYISQLSFWTGGSSPDFYRTYIDAVGYSWDPYYNIGNNLIEADITSVLLSYDYPKSIELEWEGYSINGQQNRTTYGDKLIPFFVDGNHSIQVFGRLHDGKVIKSEVRYFITDMNAPNSLISFTPHRGIDIVNQTTRFTLSGYDGTGSGIKKIKYKINNTLWIDYESPFTIPFSAAGFYNISYYAIDKAGFIEEMNNITIELVRVSLIDIDILDHMYRTEAFNITLFLYDELGQGIDSAIIRLWWNGTQVSQSNITNLGGGIYVFSLTPITVVPGEDPIRLNMTITAADCFAKYYETYLAVDPEAIDKGYQPPLPPSVDGGGDENGGVTPDELTLVALITLIGASVTAGCIVFIIAWKKELFTKLKRK